MVLQGMGILFVLFVVLVVAFAGYLLILHNQPLVLPAPTGSYHVGRIEYDWVDNSRVDPLDDAVNEKREVLVWVWYPASESAQGSTAPFLPPAWVRAHDRDQGIGRFIESDFSSIQTHSFANAPIAESQSAYPVIIMQPGMGPVPADYTVFAEDLASHGYIVVGVNETHTSNLIVFPDGRVVLRSQEGTIPDSADPAAADADASRIGMVWTDDAVSVMDRLQTLNDDPSSFFHDRLDLADIGLFGHSFGGATAASVCETDPRCKAGADLDGTLFSYQSKERLHTPFMFMAEDRCGKNCDTMYQAYSTSDSAAYYLSIKGVRHFNFSDLPLRLLPLARVPFRLVGYIGWIDPKRGSEIAGTYLVAFFDRYLKDVPSDLLRASSSAYPEVRFERH
jgi:predicted dienelactone hydrolase